MPKIPIRFVSGNKRGDVDSPLKANFGSGNRAPPSSGSVVSAFDMSTERNLALDDIPACFLCLMQQQQE